LNKDQAYHQIALACLKTLRSGNAASNEDTAKALYESIDAAFEQQFALVLAELQDSQARLNAIKHLDPNRHSLADALEIIDHNGTAH
tara:strand:+ start:3432 stop:3692 length:261 start_codon:yes stop_codon:yes gene_type:complete